MKIIEYAKISKIRCPRDIAPYDGIGYLVGEVKIMITIYPNCEKKT